MINFTAPSMRNPFISHIARLYRNCVLPAVLCLVLHFPAAAQYDIPLYTSYTTVKARTVMKDNLIHYSIEKNFSLPLTDSTEENWQDAFAAMEVMQYGTPLTLSKVTSAFEGIEGRTVPFQRSLLELAYSNYPGKFLRQVSALMQKTADPKIFAMCAEYLMQSDKGSEEKAILSRQLHQKFADTASANPVLYMLETRLSPDRVSTLNAGKVLSLLLGDDFLPHKEVMYSLQRANRDYPGLVIIRNPDGEFVRDSTGRLFSVRQLARSITNLPSYLTNGNTPQGIFKMYGFKVSMGNFIGPTANVQLGMPVELTPQQFFDDGNISDTTWSVDDYRKLIPAKLQSYFPLYQSYYAGAAGRSEIIAHGTTIDPDYYRGKPYYPLTPTEGCLCTKEIWNGKRIFSDQQKLVNGLLQAGGADGYCVVIEIDNKKAPVTLADILPYLPGEKNK